MAKPQKVESLRILDEMCNRLDNMKGQTLNVSSGQIALYHTLMMLNATLKRAREHKAYIEEKILSIKKELEQEIKTIDEVADGAGELLDILETRYKDSLVLEAFKGVVNKSL